MSVSKLFLQLFIPFVLFGSSYTDALPPIADNALPGRGLKVVPLEIYTPVTAPAEELLLKKAYFRAAQDWAAVGEYFYTFSDTGAEEVYTDTANYILKTLFHVNAQDRVDRTDQLTLKDGKWVLPQTYKTHTIRFSNTGSMLFYRCFEHLRLASIKTIYTNRYYTYDSSGKLSGMVEAYRNGNNNYLIYDSCAYQIRWANDNTVPAVHSKGTYKFINKNGPNTIINYAEEIKYSFDSQGKLASALYEKLDADNGLAVLEKRRYEYTYLDNRIYKERCDKWDDSSQAYIPFEKVHYSYNSAGLVSQMTECTYWSAHTDSAAYSYRYDAFNNVSEYIKSTARTKYKELYFYCYTPSFPDPNKAGNNPAVQSVIVNPNTGHAVFTLFLPVPSNISGVIYTLSGREVARFGGDKTYSHGVQRILWDGQSDNNRPVSSGVYFYSLTTGHYTVTGVINRISR